MSSAAEIAEKAAAEFGCKVVLPQFPSGVSGSDWNDLHQTVGLGEVRRQIHDQALDPWPPPIDLKEPSNAFTDAANAQRFVSQFSREVLCIDGIGWHRWDGSRWVRDEHFVDRCAQEIGRFVRDEAIKSVKIANDSSLSQGERDAADTKAKALIAWAKSSESLYRITATKKLAAAHLSYTAAQFDADPLLLNCTNGTIDLRTGELRSARRGDLITKSTGIPYDPTASYEVWEKTVLDICCGDVELMRYLQRVMGYCLTGLTTEQVMFIFKGGSKRPWGTMLEWRPRIS
jgi:putative DNA primase/helicase